jgi:hypothetical protein
MGSPRSIASQFVRLASQCNLQAQVAIAATPDVALHAARGFRGITIIAAGTEAATLASLPVEILNPDPGELQILLDWGIANFKSLARLPVISLASRLGQKGPYLRHVAEPIARLFRLPLSLDFRKAANWKNQWNCSNRSLFYRIVCSANCWRG